ncbi:SEC-C domain-containing protein, partial [bacterium]|nr:SEC-C domain-containing protein [bacterium]
QAIEAKENVKIERETQTLATITLQNYFRMYAKLSGMTGTAETEAGEFWEIYKLDVSVTSTNEPIRRIDYNDVIYKTTREKYNAVIDEIERMNKIGRPVLVGTISVEVSETLSRMLKRRGIKHNVLNAKHHKREAEIVTNAGQPGAVTIATNMAGRGTDIKLARQIVKCQEGCYLQNPGKTPPDDINLEECEASMPCGLHIIGTERHESRRIDRQLRGRAGRQGDPGESRFYISLEDELIKNFAGDTLKNNMQRFGMQDDEVIESKYVSKIIERSQEKVEKRNFEIRKHLIEYDDVLNQQRTVVYTYRRAALEGENDIYGLVRDLITKAAQTIVHRVCPVRKMNSEQADKMYQMVAQLTGLTSDDLVKQGLNEKNSDEFKKDLVNLLLSRYQLYRKQQQDEVIQEAEKWLILETIDQAWKQHMVNLDHLKEGIGLRGWGQKNPLIEYKRESFAMFQDMMEHVRFDIVHHIFHLNLERFDSQGIEEKRERELDELNMSAGATDEGAVEQRISDKIGRNDPCPCGSEKKYKKCCGKGK